MDTDLISFESLLAAKEASNWAFWTMVASLISAFSAFATIIFAALALNTWRKQEILKNKVNFKQAILELEDALLAMPEKWSYIQVNVARTLLKLNPEISNHSSTEVDIYFKKNDLTVAYKHAVKCWIMCDGIFEKSCTSTDWNTFSEQYRDYIMRGGNKVNLQPLLEKIAKGMKLF